MAKELFFDAGPVISLVMSRLAWILPELKKHFNGKFLITPAVELELVTRPLTVHRFQFEALQVLKLIREGTLEVYRQVPAQKVRKFKSIANSAFLLEGKAMDVLQEGEMESVTSALELKAAVVMDERTLRLFIENPSELQSLLESRFRKQIQVQKDALTNFSRSLQGISIIRSVELVATAYRLGLLDSYVPPQKEGRELLLEAVLWATKYNGCAVTEHEIEEIKETLLAKKPSGHKK